MFNEDILIDRNKLEEECSTAPGFFDYWQNQEADLKTRFDNHEANLGRTIRTMDDPTLKATYGISKITEGAISSIIKSDPEYQSLKRQYVQAEASRKSYDKKISMLDVLARLHGQGYFAKIESKKDTRTLLAKHVKEKIRAEIEKRSMKPKRPVR